MLSVLIGVGLLLAVLVGFNLRRGAKARTAMAGQGEPSQTVTTVEARLETWQPVVSAVGTVRAVLGADLAFEVAGVVTEVLVRPGRDVSKDQVLVALDDRVEQAQLEQLQASATLAEATHRRAREQLAARIISPSAYETAEADLKARQAGVRSQKALLARKRLRAPFPGRAGIMTASPGSHVEPGKPVLTLQRLDAVHVDFPVPQKHAGMLEPGQVVTLAVDAHRGRTFTGSVTAISPKVDSSTRNLQVEATFANGGGKLLPGMFARVSLDLGPPREHVTLPQTAVIYNPYGTAVFLARRAEPGGGLVAKQVFVTTGATREDQVAILDGLRPGEVAVSSGGLKLKEGTPLVVQGGTQPAASMLPCHGNRGDPP